jgi:thiol-disulfide isomerase/thioredoxin
MSRLRTLTFAAALALVACAHAAAQQHQHPQPAQPVASPQAPQPAATPNPNAGHEYAPLVEKEINYKDWTYKSLADGAPVNLREWAKGKRLVMVVYFAPWCGNWKMEAPVLSRLYDKYKQHGFDVIAVSEYATADDSRKYFEKAGLSPFPVVVESEAREDRDKTTHYGYRQACGDARKWGSPFNVFLEPSKLKGSGEVVAERAWVVTGELIEKEAEQFIRQKLGLPETTSVAPGENKKQ